MKLFRRPWFWWGVGAGLALPALIWAAYRFGWPGTGFEGKTVWDWLQLLIVPAALALVALFFNQANMRTEQKIAQQRYEHDQHIALDKQHEDLLQAYLDRMSELLLEKGLRSSPEGAEVRNVARTRTISVLRQLDVRRVADVFTFLREAGLTDPSHPVISLNGADLSEVKWHKARLSKVNLSGAILTRADLSYAWLEAADLSGARVIFADLTFANLEGADLTEARLTRANLHGAWLEAADLSGARLNGADLSEPYLSGANLTGANLKGADIEKSELSPEQISQAIWEEEAPSGETQEGER